MNDTILQLNNLTLKNNQGNCLLKDITFQLKKQEILGVFGSSGCGKSLLCKAILNLTPKNFTISGEIVYNNQNITSKKCQPSNISLMFQNVEKSLNPLLSNGKHLLQLLYGNNKIDRAHLLLQSLGFTNPHEIMRKYPSHLSGGELSRFGLCLAIANGPDVLILDEAFASIDNKLSKLFEKQIRKYVVEKKKSVIIVTHNPDIIIKLTDRVLIMENGEITETLDSYDFLNTSKTNYIYNIKKAYDRLYVGIDKNI